MLRSTTWLPPTRLFTTTYDRADHTKTTLDLGVVGVRKDRASKANQLQAGDWILIRISGEFGGQSEELVVIRPGRVTGRPVLEKDDRSVTSPWPRLLWPEEVETQRLIYPFRVPVSFEGAPRILLGCFTWANLRGLGLRGAKGQLLETPQQWGIRFAGNLVDDPREVNAIVRLIDDCACAGPRAG